MSAPAAGRRLHPEEAGFFYMDAMRCVAASAVVLNHVRDLILVDASQATLPGLAATLVYLLAGFGHQSVMIFFVLSGFWITRAVVRREDRPAFWQSFLIDRLSRLLIVMVPALVVGGALDAFGTWFVAPSAYDGSSGAHSMPDVAATLSLPALLGNLVFLQGLVTPPFGSNGPLWSVAYEFWYYIWFPALWLARRGRFSIALLGLAIGLLDVHLAYGFVSWLCGSALAFALQAAVQRDWVGRRGIAAPVLFGGALLLIAALAFSRRFTIPFWTDVVISAAFALTLFGLCLWLPQRRRAFQWLTIYGARASFSLYAIHYPVGAFFISIVLAGKRLQPSGGALALVGLAWLALIGIGWLFASVTERHTPAIRDRLQGRRIPSA